MALKNFAFRENWVVSEVAGMKIAFFPIFDPTWTHILAPKGKILIFNLLKRQKLYYYRVCDLKSDLLKVKN